MLEDNDKGDYKLHEIFDIIINIISVDEVNSGHSTAKMIGFNGTCEGQYFNGEIMDNGVDTQLFSKDGRGRVSARYMMKGVDSSLTQCRIFIENEGEISCTGEILTTPKIVTDSMELSWLQEETLHGKVAVEEDNRLHVRIYV